MQKSTSYDQTRYLNFKAFCAMALLLTSESNGPSWLIMWV